MFFSWLVAFKKTLTVDYFLSLPHANSFWTNQVLDAPELMDDYYLNLLDWSSGNTLAVALGKTVYLWNATSGEIEELMQTQGEEDHITSVSFVEEGNFLAIGTNSATVQIWDVAAMKQGLILVFFLENASNVSRQCAR